MHTIDVPFTRLQLPLGAYQTVVVRPRPELGEDYEQGGSPFTAPIYQLDFSSPFPKFKTERCTLVLDKDDITNLQRLTTLLKQPMHPSYAYDYMFQGVEYFQIERD